MPRKRQTPSKPAPRRRRRGPAAKPEEVILGIAAACAWLVAQAFRLVWRFFIKPMWRFAMWDWSENAPQITGGKSIRDRDDWKSEWSKVRSGYIRMARRILGADNLHCMICDCKLVKITVDHRTPVDLNARLSFDQNNLRLCCQSCNSSKGNRLEFMEDRRPLKLKVASEQERRRYLQKNNGVDPIHAIIARHEEEKPRGIRALWQRA